MSPEKKQQAMTLRKQGHTIKYIANELDCSKATVSIVVREVSLAMPKRQKKINLDRNFFDPAPFVEEVFASKPDHVLFQHVRVWDFIG